MEFTFNTQIVDVSVSIKALDCYRERAFTEAAKALLDVLDMEPRNWQARLMLGACYFKTGQYGAAQRAFRALYDRCDEADIKSKALEALHASNAKLERQTELPAEFGLHMASSQPARLSWLD